MDERRIAIAQTELDTLIAQAVKAEQEAILALLPKKWKDQNYLAGSMREQQNHGHNEAIDKVRSAIKERIGTQG